MLPYIGLSTFSIGPVTVQVWGAFVALGFLVGTWFASRRARSRGMDGKVIWDVAFWMLIGAFLGARLFHVLFYDFSHYLSAPWEAFDPRLPGYAMYGGLLGGAGAFWWYMHRRGLAFLEWADVTIWGVPLGCGIGRIGCFLIHDHPGTLSDSLLALKFPNGESRHDLGLYLSLVGFTIAILFLIMDRLPGSSIRSPGFWLGLFLVLDGISRLWLDFYRVADVTYVYLTPTQWLTVPLIGIGLWLIRRARQLPEGVKR